MPPLLIIQTDVYATSSPALAEQSGEIDRIFLRALGMGEGEATIAAVCSGATLPRPEEISSVVITGSTAMVTDGTPWIERTAGWLREAQAAGTPMLGVCFGHQLMAQAFGGQVGATPTGPEYGTVEIEALPEARGDPLLADLPPRFSAQSAHYQSVLVPPAGSTVLARNASGIHALRFGPRAWGVQFHPELGPDDLRAILTGRRDRLGRSGVEVESALGDLRPTPHAASVLPRFRALFADSRQAA